jgi:hypothetical protein
VKFTRNIGLILLALYLICIGIMGLTNVLLGQLPAIIALLAGIFLLIGK